MKRIIIVILMIALLCCACSEKEGANEATVNNASESIVKTEISGTKNIWIIGDSLAAAAPKNNESEGWGSYLQLYLTSGVSVKNMAVGGASASSYLDGGLLNTILENVQENDCVIIQFGHNDAWNMEIYTDPYGSSEDAGSFKWILKNEYILPILEKGAYPFLATSVVAADFDESGELYTMIYADHAEAMRQLVQECQSEGLAVNLIDTYEITENYYNEIGETKATILHVGNHYNRDGAIYAAGVISDEMKKLNVSCFENLRTKEQVEALDLAGNYDIYAIGQHGLVTYADITAMENQYINEGFDENTSKEKATEYMLKKEALYQDAIKAGYEVSESDFEKALQQLKNNTTNSMVKRSLPTYANEENYWNYKSYALKRDMTVEKYIEQLKQEYDGEEDFDVYFEELMSDLVEEEEYVFILNRGFNLEIE